MTRCRDQRGISVEKISRVSCRFIRSIFRWFQKRKFPLASFSRPEFLLPLWRQNGDLNET